MIHRRFSEKKRYFLQKERKNALVNDEKKFESSMVDNNFYMATEKCRIFVLSRVPFLYK